MLLNVDIIRGNVRLKNKIAQSCFSYMLMKQLNREKGYSQLLISLRYLC